MSKEPQDEVALEAVGLLQTLCLFVVGIKPKTFLWLDVLVLPDLQTNALSNNDFRDEWEREAYEYCQTKLIVEKVMAAATELAPHIEAINRNLADILKLCRLQRKTAIAALAGITGKQMLKGNSDAAKVIADGLANMEKGNAFRPKTGPKKSADMFLTLLAFQDLKQGGVAEPSQTEVGKHLESKGFPIGKDRLSKNFDALGLSEQASDSREAMSKSGKRRRGIT
jgi:hypothetical protein